MMAYAVTGTLTPDATGNTGEPAGEYNGQPYWMWTNEAGTWYLYAYAYAFGDSWMISKMLGGVPSIPVMPYWRGTPGTPGGGMPSVAGSYSPYGATGTAVVAELASPPRLRGVLQLVISHLNGEAIIPAKHITLAEFDE